MELRSPCRRAVEISVLSCHRHRRRWYLGPHPPQPPPRSRSSAAVAAGISVPRCHRGHREEVARAEGDGPVNSESGYVSLSFKIRVSTGFHPLRPDILNVLGFGWRILFVLFHFPLLPTAPPPTLLALATIVRCRRPPSAATLFRAVSFPLAHPATNASVAPPPLRSPYPA